MWQSRPWFHALTRDIVQDVIDKCDGSQWRLDEFRIPVFEERGARFACFNRELSNGQLVRFDEIPWYRKSTSCKEIKPRKHRLILSGQHFLVLNCVCAQSETFKKHMIFGDNLDVFYVIYVSKEPIHDYQTLQNLKKQMMPDEVIMEARAALTRRTVDGALEFLRDNGLAVTKKQLQNQTRNVRSVIKSWMTEQEIVEVLEDRTVPTRKKKRRKRTLEQELAPFLEPLEPVEPMELAEPIQAWGALEPEQDLEQEPSCSNAPPLPTLQSKIKTIWSQKAVVDGEHSFFVKKSSTATSFVEVKLSEYDQLSCTYRLCKNRLPQSCEHIKAVLPLLPPDRQENVMSTLSTQAPTAPWVYEPDKNGHGRVFRKKFGYREMGELSRGVAPPPAPTPPAPAPPELKPVKEEDPDDDDIMETFRKLTAKRRRC